MKTTRHSLMAKGIMILLSLLVLVFAFTYGWFTDPAAPVTASGISVSTESGADVNLAIGFSTSLTGGEYLISDFTSSEYPKIDFEHINVTKNYTIGSVTVNSAIAQNDQYNLLVDFKPIDLTGDGVELYRPAMLSKNKAIDYSSNKVDTDLVPNKHYITFDLYTKSEKSDYTVMLDTGSYVVAAAEASNTTDAKQLATNIANQTETLPDASDIDGTYAKLKGDNVTRKSDYGPFSEDTVVGAVRVAFTQYTIPNDATLSGIFGNTYSLNSSTRRLWIPRSDMYLQDQSNEDYSNYPWTLVTKADSNWASGVPTFNNDSDFGAAVAAGHDLQNPLTYKSAAAEHWYYDKTKITNETNSARYTNVSDVYTTITSSSNCVIINAIPSVSTIEGGKTYYYGKCRVNLWIEGCDAEARRAIDGGSFFFGFDLSAK